VRFLPLFQHLNLNKRKRETGKKRIPGENAGDYQATLSLKVKGRGGFHHPRRGP